MEDTKKTKNKKSLNDYYMGKKIDLSDNAVKVLERRYLKRDAEGVLLEKPGDMFIRVAGNIASAEKKYGKTEEEVKEIEKQFFNIMADLDFLPNSPTLMNAGKELQQLAACFVLPVGDSMNAIFEALKETALIQKSGGGVGYSFSNIRPKNDVVLSTKGVSSGPISFMTVFNAATDTIKQGGTRRGANMGILRVDHPDILDFITSKENNEKLTNFNISVGVTEKFMKAVENDDEYEIINPRTKEVVDRYRAKEVFDKIVEHAWKNGDPGIIFLDRLNKDNPTPNLGQIESTNPCISGETFISTDRGLVKAKDLYQRIQAGEEIKILFDRRALEYKILKKFTDKNLDILESRNIKSWNRGKKDVYKLITCSGYELEATAEHKMLTVNGYKKLMDLVKGDEILIQPVGKFTVSKKIFSNGKVKELNNFTKRKTLNLPEYWSSELGEVLGWLIGDGWLRDDRVGFTFGCEDKELALYFNQIMRKWYNCNIKEIVRENRVIHLSYYSKGFIEFFKELGVKACTSSEKEVPVSLFSAPKEAVTGFLNGLFSSDGNIDDTDGTIKISSSSKKLLKGVQVLLLSLGVKSNILTRKYSFSKNFSYVNKYGEHKSYKAKNENYFELFISGGVSEKRFQQEIGFILERKENLLNSFKFEKLSPDNYYNKFIDKVDKIRYVGKKEVFDFNEPVSNSYIANGIVVRNCGEQPLLPYEACNLGSINLAHMVKEEEGIKKVDYDRLKNITYTAVRFLDDVIDMSRYPLEKIGKMVRGNRKIGLGVMGYADLLIILGIPYDSEEALELAQKIMSFIQDESKNASRELAKEKGVFPNFKGSVYDSPDGYEIRNATTTTIAPTGTLSIIADCSSGVEPIFALSFVKNVMDNDRLVEVNDYFEELAKKEGFYSKKLMKKIAEKGNLKDIEEVPSRYRRVFVTAHEISPVWHVRTQAAFQKFVDNAVSKTVNFSNDATVQDVENVYMLAYRLGCKGITIFRDKSRGTQVLEVEEKKKGFTEVKEENEVIEENKEEIKDIKLKPRSRPEITHGMTKKYKIGNCGKLYVTVNSDENGICEVFINTGEEGCTALTEAVGRLISIAIRSGIDIESVKKQVIGIRCITCIADNETYVLSCPDAMGKAIEFYMNGSNKFDLSKTSGPRSIMICPEDGCGGIMEPEGGCYVCRNCGYSKCS
ncbi:MAG: ribonucleotide reductase N-terminal alpha domain-containing protein [Actinomycetota bacterium]|nr:ribonucleotide reductase N-terminal alpha domain-containing protein [Actinomycetota bacterium]